jgi:bacterioferritin-associated ferredoxin
LEALAINDSEILAGYVANLKSDDIPPDVLDRVKPCTLDSVRAAIGAAGCTGKCQQPHRAKQVVGKARSLMRNIRGDGTDALISGILALDGEWPMPAEI